MAKVGEGDPRWVVQNREDGRNVNNWHWSETDCVAWCKKHFTSVFTDLTLFDDTEGSCNTRKVQNFSGECTANVRKGKTIFFYELEAKISWEGKLQGGEDVIKGHFSVPYISEEVDDDKIEVKAVCDTDSKLSEIVSQKGVPIVQKKVAEFLAALKEEFTVKKPAQPEPAQNSLPAFQHPPSGPSSSTKQDAPKTEPKPKSSLNTTTIKLKDEFRGSRMDVYKSMTDPSMLNAIMSGTANMDPKEGGKFSMFAGTVTGENVKLVPGKKIVQKWRFTSWPEGHYSKVTMDFEDEDGSTVVKLTQEGVPADDERRTEEGWRQNLWGRAKMMFGFGGMVF